MSQTPEQLQALKLKEEGNEFYKNKKLDEALSSYKKAHELDPNNIVFLNNMAAVYLEQKNYDQCIKTCEEAVTLGRSHYAPLEAIARALQRTGTAHSKQGNYEEAISFYKKAQIEHRDKQTLELLKQAEKTLEEKKTKEYINPELSKVAKEEGNQFFKEAKFPEAVKSYTEAINRNPTDPIPYSNRATAYTKLGALPEALKDCEKAIELDKKFLKAYMKKGHVHFMMKDFQKAMKTYEQALEFEPNNPDLESVIRKTMNAIQSGGHDVESVKRNVENDPELQAIISDPMMQQVLKDIVSNPKTLENYMKDPTIAQNIRKLIAAGVIGTK